MPFGLPKGADTDQLFLTIAGAAADLLAQEGAMGERSKVTKTVARDTGRGASRQ
ncbi:MAG: hypothetical protein IPM90_06645 [Austwickia sp.]|nr:hypothetical protein [Austwickia sp.]